MVLPNLTENITLSQTSIYDDGSIELYFCPQDDCERAVLNLLEQSTVSIHCALYEIGLYSIQQKLLDKARILEVQIVTDNDYLKKFNHSFVKADKSGLMHNKFCIIDNHKLFTGSMNPTENDIQKNNNNLLIITSQQLAWNYEQEFQELWNGTFKKGNPVLNPSIQLNNIILENYFCPEDHCAKQVKEELKNAEKNIEFMTFSFTHESIANILLLKHLDNISIRGVMETRQIDEDSRFNILTHHNIPVLKDKNKNNLHHKAFIIDNKTVITGSFNPTKGGNERNDENLLIIHDLAIAEQFAKEFQKVWMEALQKE